MSIHEFEEVTKWKIKAKMLEYNNVNRVLNELTKSIDDDISSYCKSINIKKEDYVLKVNPDGDYFLEKVKQEEPVKTPAPPK